MSKLITILIMAAVVIGLLPDDPTAGAAPPPCDQPTMSACTWQAEVDGRSVVLPGCDQEDGNTDGRPCLWFNEGRTWFVTSENYR